MENITPVDKDKEEYIIENVDYLKIRAIQENTEAINKQTIAIQKSNRIAEAH